MAEVGFYVHGIRAKSLSHLERYINGDSHDQSKVEYFDGISFHSVGFTEYPSRFVQGIPVVDLIDEVLGEY